MVVIIDRILRGSKVSIAAKNYQFHKRFNDPSYLSDALACTFADINVPQRRGPRSAGDPRKKNGYLTDNLSYN